MDMSKLPRMSNTPAPPPTPADLPPPSPADAEYDPRMHYARREPVSIGAGPEAWLSIAIGVILILMTPQIFQYLVSPESFAKNYTFSAADGSPLKYPQTVFFWGHLSLTMFAIVLILEGLVIMFGRKVGLVAIALVLTIVAVLMNAFYVDSMMVSGYGLQIISAMAVAFGGYIAIFEWKLLQSLRANRAAAAVTPPPSATV